MSPRGDRHPSLAHRVSVSRPRGAASLAGHAVSYCRLCPESLDDYDDGPEFRPPEWAFAINFFWPGAGLVYLRRPWAGLLNFIIVIALAAALWVALPKDKRQRVAPWLGLIFCGASGIWAYSAAHDYNDRRELEFESQHNRHEPGPGGESG